MAGQISRREPQMTVIDDLPWARIGTALGLTPKTAKTRAITAL
jgi:hypothetical protein